jgi:hypothetical protein
MNAWFLRQFEVPALRKTNKAAFEHGRRKQVCGELLSPGPWCPYGHSGGAIATPFLRPCWVHGFSKLELGTAPPWLWRPSYMQVPWSESLGTNCVWDSTINSSRYGSHTILKAIIILVSLASMWEYSNSAVPKSSHLSAWGVSVQRAPARGSAYLRQATCFKLSWSWLYSVTNQDYGFFVY